MFSLSRKSFYNHSLLRLEDDPSSWDRCVHCLPRTYANMTEAVAIDRCFECNQEVLVKNVSSELNAIN
jgi:hypothetical protein